MPALRFAASLALRHDAVLLPMLTWVPPGGELADRRYASKVLHREWERAAWGRLHGALDTAFGGLPADVTTELVVLRGEPGWVLAHAASRDGDLLVIGSGRHRRLWRSPGGKVSRYCLAHAACPVLAVPPSPLEAHSRHSLAGWVFWHRGLRELTDTPSGSPAQRD